MAVQVRAPQDVVDAFFRDKYDEDAIMKLTQDHNILWKWMPKSEDGGDRRLIVPIMFEDPQAVAPTRAGVQAIQGTSGGSIRGDDWVIPWGGEKGGYEITLTDMMLNRKQMKKWLTLESETFEGTLRTWGDVHETYLCRSPGHALGSGVFTAATGVLQLANAADAINFRKGGLYQISANDGSSDAHVLVANSGIGYCVGVNANTGAITFSATDGGAGGAPLNWANAATYYVFRYLEFGGTASPYKIVDSIFDWVPKTDPSATAFNGVDRTQNIVALSGVRVLSTEGPSAIDQRLEYAMERESRIGYFKRVGGERAWFISGTQWLNLKNRLRSFGTLDLTPATPEWGFEAINLRGPWGRVPVYTADKLADTDAVCLAKKTWKFTSVGKYPQMINQDGQVCLRKATEDVFEWRLDGMGALCCRGPGANIYCALPTS